jgi:hypothetical protein
MFKNRVFNPLVRVAIIVLAVLSISAVIYAQQVPSATADNRFGVLDWYFNHDHAILDGDNNRVSSTANVAPANRFGALDWYFNHDHAILDGDNNSMSTITNVAPADRVPSAGYIALKDRQLNQMDAVSARSATDNIPIEERYSTLKDQQLERTDPTFSIGTVPSAQPGSERYMNFKDAQLERYESGSNR